MTAYHDVMIFDIHDVIALFLTRSLLLYNHRETCGLEDLINWCNFDTNLVRKYRVKVDMAV